MSERVLAAVGVWDGVDSSIYDRIEVVENTNLKGHVQTRAYAINAENSSKRKQVANIYRGADPDVIQDLEDDFLEDQGVLSTERFIYGRTEDEWKHNTALIAHWEANTAAGNRHKKDYTKYATDAEIVGPVIAAYETFLADNPEILDNISIEEGFIVNERQELNETTDDSDTKETELILPEHGPLTKEDSKVVDDWEAILAMYPDSESAKSLSAFALAHSSSFDERVITHEKNKAKIASIREAEDSVEVEEQTVSSKRLSKAGLAGALIALRAAPLNMLVRSQNSLYNRLSPKTINLKENGEHKRGVGKKTTAVLFIGGLALGAAAGYALNKYGLPKLADGHSHSDEAFNNIQSQLQEARADDLANIQIIDGLEDRIHDLKDHINDLQVQASVDQTPSTGGSGGAEVPQVPSGGSSGGGSSGANTLDLSNLSTNTITAKTPNQFVNGVFESLHKQGIDAHGVTTERVQQIVDGMKTGHWQIVSGMEINPSGGLRQHVVDVSNNWQGGHTGNYQASGAQAFTSEQDLEKFIRLSNRFGITFTNR